MPWLFMAVMAAGCTEAPDALPVSGWSSYGGDAGGSRYSELAQINRTNVSQLEVAWTARTGDFSHDDDSQGPVSGCGQCHTSASKFEATPIFARGRLYLSTPLNRVLALDPGTGEELWRHDPAIRMDLERNEGFVSRGVSYWQDAARPDATCGARIFMGTIDARLIALDAGTGALCAGFGEDGTVRLDRDVGRVQEGQYGVTSPPAIAGDVIVVGSSMGDNRRVDMERGTVRGYDARTGALRWTFDPIPRDSTHGTWAEWTPDAAAKTGAANAWAPISADIERNLVFVPTGSAAPDFYGGERPGDNRYANSVVALRASTGEVVWHFQVVHHDLWDYDVASQPSLITVPRDGEAVPAVAVATKTGFLFVLDRETGEPLFPVEERPVPPSTVPGEQASPTQPFPIRPAPLHPMGMTLDDVWGATPEDLASCRDLVASLRNEGIFTPPSLEGTLMFPGFGGGVNWGGLAWDRAHDRVIVNVLRLATWVRLQPRSAPDRGNQIGTPYHMTRAPLLSQQSMPCTKPPWGTLMAIDVSTGDIVWERPFGSIPALAGVPESETWGSASFGGPIVTGGGIVFIAAAQDELLRAYDVDTGIELWSAQLPAGGQATPMTYEFDGRQYVVIAAGGHGNLGTTLGDHVIAYALPQLAR
ncbi:MAG: pyrroloquinoline quinone-dependent dehydrogenase [Longimicrobiales bacterium]